MEYSLGAEFEAELLSVARPTGKTAVPASSIESVTDEEKKVIEEACKISAATWFGLSRWAKETGNFQPWQRSLLFKVGTLVGRGQKPSYKQSNQALLALAEAERKGFSV